MKYTLSKSDCIGLVRPAVDAHTLGISSVEQILRDCGLATVVADAVTCEAFGTPRSPASAAVIERWLRQNRVTVLGFSYRLDPREGPALFERLVHELNSRGLLVAQGGPIKAVYFAGLPAACRIVKERVPETNGVFCGDETPAETLGILGVNAKAIPNELVDGISYDEARLAFGRELIQKGRYLAVTPVDRSGYEGFGTKTDTLVARVQDAGKRQLPPIMRAHVGPYMPDRKEAVGRFVEWTRTLATSGYLDVLSIGTSQLTQSDFGTDWGGRPNGGGVPLNSPEEFAAVWQAARPMLVRAYAGTRDIPALAKMYEQTIHIAWHALPLWWFCQIDGRGPYTVRENLQQHIDTLKYIASTGKPFEANVPHHFAFRGADDVTYIVSAVLAAKLAKSLGIRDFILQNMLNTPKYSWGIQDLAKSRAMLRLVRELEDENFHVIFQPRGGLDYFSPDLDKAKAQLAAVTALMDDIEPHDPSSPGVIHVVSYSEASHLADPSVVNESIQITRCALKEYRQLRRKGLIDNMAKHPEVAARTETLVAQAAAVMDHIEAMIAEPYTAEGLYRVFASGFLPVPYLWECRDEFRHAVEWHTRVVRGGVEVVDQNGRPMAIKDRMRRVATSAGLTL